MTHVCDAYKTKWDGNNFLKRDGKMGNRRERKKRGWLKKPNF